MTKRKRAAVAVLAIVILSLFILITASQQRLGLQGAETIALLRLAGPIEESGGSLLGAGAITPALVSERLVRAEEDPSVRALVVRVSSPGGSVAASQEVAAMFDDFPKPLVVSMGDIATSGGYYIAAGADAIIAQPGTLTGSIGVIWTQIDPEQLLDELGVELDAITAGKHKEMFLPGRLTPERKRIIQDIVDDDYTQFVTAVAKGRDMAQQDVETLATGEPFNGAQALSLGLVDELGGEDEAIQRAEELAGLEDARVKVLTPSFFERLSAGSGLSFTTRSDIPSTTTPLDPRILLLRDVLLGLDGPRYEVP